MSSNVSGKIWDLKEEAKWARDTDSQIKAIRELSTLGAIAIPSLEEIRAINTREEIKQCCIDSIRSISDKSSEGTTNVNETSLGESNSSNKKNQQEEKTEEIEKSVVA